MGENAGGVDECGGFLGVVAFGAITVGAVDVPVFALAVRVAAGTIASALPRASLPDSRSGVVARVGESAFARISIG